MIEFQNVTKTYDSGLTVLKQINLSVNKGDLVILIGPSGCGKSTLLRMVNRMLDITSGQIMLDGQSVASLDPVKLRQRIGYVIQSIGLFPHLTIQENVELVPSITGVAAPQRQARARELLHLMGLDPAVFGARYPRQLSGGQQQRVGIARALAADPEYLLMDEPFSAVDPITREKLQDQFLTLKREIGKTILFVTHDIDEAVRLGDKICLLEGGHVQQYGTPDELLHRPANPFVAAFVGENRELKRLSLRPVSSVMSRTQSSDAAGQVAHDLSAERALALLLGAGGQPLNVTDADGQIIGSLRLQDYGHL